jgi:capsular exopolysaccharide synthesis family protein
VFLLRYWWIPVLTLAVGFVGGIVYVYLKTPTFFSQASMFETVKVRLPEGSLFSEDVQNFLGTQTELLQSGRLRELALTRLRATMNPAAIPVDRNGDPISVGIRVSGSAKSSVFTIDATSSNPLFTQKYLDALMDSYLEYKKNLRREVSGDTLASISEQVQRWEQDLKTEQDALTAFQRTNNLAVLQEEGTIAGSYLVKLKTQLSDLQLEARLLNAAQHDRDQAEAGDTNAAAAWTDMAVGLADSSSTGSQNRQAALRELELLKIQRDRLGKFLRPKHPKMVKLSADIEQAEQLLDIFRRQSREELREARRANQVKTDNVLASISEWEVRVVDANSRVAEAERLKLNVQRVQSVYDRLVTLVQNVGISRNIDQENLAILEHASPARRSYTEEKSRLGLAIFGGLAAGMGVVLLISIRDDRFICINEVNSALGDAVVGLLPDVSSEGNDAKTVLELDDARHVYAESYRSLRSALLFLTTDRERPKVLLITSAMPNEGKSTVAANLARTLALSGSRVLLVDADLRKGHLHSLLGLRSEPGLAEVLNRTCELEMAVQTNCIPNLCFVPRGGRSSNPGDLFLGSDLDQILARWRREFDFVVIDSSPLFAADDASCLAPKVDGTLFIVRNQHSSARAVRHALDILAMRQAKVLGVVFNGADASARSYYYYKYADYYSSSPPG